MFWGKDNALPPNGTTITTELRPTENASQTSPEPGSSYGSDLVPSKPFDEKRLVRRIDGRVLPMLFLIYVAAFLDRVNISNALTMSLPKDLGLSGQQPNIALTIFFVPYIIFEIPSNILMKRFNPHIWLSCCILAFGIITICQGCFVHTYGGLLATRFFLGLAEAGIFPGSFYLISFWYPFEEAQKRFTVYWSSVILAGAFGGLLATGIANMDGVRGLANWRWIFILEGILTILIGVAAFFFVTDFPREAKWLNSAEKEFVLNKTGHDESHTVSVKPEDIKKYFSDVKNHLGAVMYLTIAVPIYALAYFTPTIVQTLGYSLVQTQLHSVPPFAAAFGLCLAMAYLSDLIRLRLPFVLFGDALLIVGEAILLHRSSQFSVNYAGICLTAMGGFGVGASIVCWCLMNLEGHRQRSVGSAWMVGFGNIGAIVATFAFQKHDAPAYHTGYSILMAMAVLGTLVTVLYAILVSKERGRKSQDGGDKTHKLLL